jgi:hypothetical protein
MTHLNAKGEIVEPEYYCGLEIETGDGYGDVIQVERPAPAPSDSYDDGSIARMVLWIAIGTPLVFLMVYLIGG